MQEGLKRGYRAGGWRHRAALGGPPRRLGLRRAPTPRGELGWVHFCVNGVYTCGGALCVGVCGGPGVCVGCWGAAGGGMR